MFEMPRRRKSGLDSSSRDLLGLLDGGGGSGTRVFGHRRRRSLLVDRRTSARRGRGRFLVMQRGLERAGDVGTVLERLARGDRDEDERDGGREEGDPADDDVRLDRRLGRVGERLAHRFEDLVDQGRRDAGSGNDARLGGAVVLLRPAWRQ
jgi:hypothetical protein